MRNCNRAIPVCVKTCVRGKPWPSLAVCVGCLFLWTPSRVPYGTPSACANRAAYPDPPPVVPHPESIDAQTAYRGLVALRVRISHLDHRDAFALYIPSSSPYAGVARLRSATTLFSTVAFNTLTNPLTICSLQIFLVTDLVSSTTRTSLTTE